MSASSRKSSPATPVGVTTSGVPLNVSPMKAIFSPVDVFTIRYEGSSGLPVLVSVTFAARYWNAEPKNGVPSWQPSTGWQPSSLAGVYDVPPFGPPPTYTRLPYCIRCSSAFPSSNSWLPTPIVSRPTEFMNSIVGSSWNRPDRSGLPPIRSPALTTYVSRFSTRAPSDEWRSTRLRRRAR